VEKEIAKLIREYLNSGKIKRLYAWVALMVPTGSYVAFEQSIMMAMCK
jgi:hypothetical protein